MKLIYERTNPIHLNASFCSLRIISLAPRHKQLVGHEGHQFTKGKCYLELKKLSDFSISNSLALKKFGLILYCIIDGATVQKQL